MAGQLQRRNSDGGAGVAGLTAGMPTQDRLATSTAAAPATGAQAERGSQGGGRSRDSHASHPDDTEVQTHLGGTMRPAQDLWLYARVGFGREILTCLITSAGSVIAATG